MVKSKKGECRKEVGNYLRQGRKAEAIINALVRKKDLNMDAVRGYV